MVSASPLLLTDEMLRTVVNRLVGALAPQSMYLFGSHVYGTPDTNSDVDLLVIVSDADVVREDLDERGYRALRGLFLPIELHIVGRQSFERRAGVPASLEHEVSTKGRLLYAA